MVQLLALDWEKQEPQLAKLMQCLHQADLQELVLEQMRK